MDLKYLLVTAKTGKCWMSGSDLYAFGTLLGEKRSCTASKKKFVVERICTRIYTGPQCRRYRCSHLVIFPNLWWTLWESFHHAIEIPVMKFPTMTPYMESRKRLWKMQEWPASWPRNAVCWRYSPYIMDPKTWNEQIIECDVEEDGLQTHRGQKAK